MELSKKQKFRSHFFAAYLKSASTFEHFEKNDDPHRLCIFEVRHCERHG